MDAVLLNETVNGTAEEEQPEETVTMSCEFFRILQQYLNDNDVKMEIKIRDDKDTPGSGLFMDRERFKTALKGTFQGPTDTSAAMSLSPMPIS